MTAYLVKEILCSAVLLLVYVLLLEREKMHRFSRFYLLLSVALAFIVPVISIKTRSRIPVADVIYLNTSVHDNISAAYEVILPNDNNLMLFVTALYIIITSILLFRFVKNIYTLFSRVPGAEIVLYNGAKLVLTENKQPPHSFWNCIFVNKEDFKSGRIEKEVLYHELTHIKQRHTVDILFIEFLRSVFWFNPVLVFYRKAIQLNHEFLADDSVVDTYGNAINYQRLLLDKASRHPPLSLVNRFNYRIMKKRLIMITKNKSRRRTLCSQLTMVPLLIGIILLFGNKGIAQDTTSPAKAAEKQTEYTKEGVSSELMDEYSSIINRNIRRNGNKALEKFSDADRTKLESIYKLMSKEQQSRVTVVFIPASAPLPARKPTVGQLKSWQNDKIYGVWIDGKKISNATLSNYKVSDFNQMFVSRLSKNAINYGKRYYQVDLMTNEYYNDYYQKALKNEGKLIMVRRFYPHNH